MADRTSLLLIVGYLAALGLGAYELRRAPALSLPPAAPEQAAPTVPTLQLPPAVISGLAAYDGIVERPLFAPDRRPQTADAAETQIASSRADDDAAIEVDGYRLTAVFKHGGSTTVLIEDPSGQTRTLHAGDQLGDWQLGEILDDRVVLVAEGRRETLMVYDFAPPTSIKKTRRVNRRIPQRTAVRPNKTERGAPQSNQP